MDMIGSNNVYEAERILDHKKIKGKRHFLIKWSGWDDTNNTWEPERNIIDKRLIEFYFKSLKEEKSTDSQKPSTKPTSKIKKEDVEPAATAAVAGKSTATTNEGGDLIRSAKREAEGLRPIKSSQSTTVAANTSSSEVSLSNSDLPSMRRRRRKLSDDMSTTTSTSAASSNKRRSTNMTTQATTMRTRSAQQQHEDGEKEKGTTASGRLRRSNRARNLTRTNLVDETTSSEDGEDDDERDIDRSNIEDMNQIISEFAETDIDPYDAEDDEIRTSNNKRNLQSNTGRNKTKKSNEDEVVKKPSVKTEKKDAYEFESEEEGETYEDEDDDDDNASATTASSSGSFFSTRTFLTSHSAAGTMSDDVVITDVTHGVVTVTIKECLTPDGFFKNRHL